MLWHLPALSVVGARKLAPTLLMGMVPGDYSEQGTLDASIRIMLISISMPAPGHAEHHTNLANATMLHA